MTKLRMVVNGLSPTSSDKLVNDITYISANLLLNFMEVLIWIYHYHHIFATDTAHDVLDLYNAGGFPHVKWHATDNQLLANISIANLFIRLTSAWRTELANCVCCLTWRLRNQTFSMKMVSLQGPVHILIHIWLIPREANKTPHFFEVAQTFNSFGFVSLIVIKAKVLLQEFWVLKLGWNDPLPVSVSSSGSS